MNIKIIFIAVLLFFTDQFTKLIIVSKNLPYQKNFGLIFLNPPSRLIFFSSIIILILLFVTLKKNQNFNLLLIFVGGLSNFIDRIVFGYVIDWIHLPIPPHSIFNLADVYICFGLFLTLLPNRHRLPRP